MRTETPLESRIRQYEDDPDYILEGLLWDINEDIAGAMERKRISRADLARRLGSSPAYVTQLLRGKRNLTLKSLTRVATALGLEVSLSLVSRGQVTAGQHLARRLVIRTSLVAVPAWSEMTIGWPTGSPASQDDGASYPEQVPYA